MILQKLLSSNERGYQRLLEGFDWYIVTILNPDGYQASHDGFM